MFREAELRRGDSIWVHLREALYVVQPPSGAVFSRLPYAALVWCHQELGHLLFGAQVASQLGEEKASPSVSWCSVTNQPPAQRLEIIMLILASLLVSRPGSDTTDLVWACLCICGQLAVELGLAG